MAAARKEKFSKGCGTWQREQIFNLVSKFAFILT